MGKKEEGEVKTKIFKYELFPHTFLQIPYGANILSVGAQHNKIVLWAEVTPKGKTLIQKEIVFYATGEEIEIPKNKRKFLGTVLLEDGFLVVHVFEVLK